MAHALGADLDRLQAAVKINPEKRLIHLTLSARHNSAESLGTARQIGLPIRDTRICNLRPISFAAKPYFFEHIFLTEFSDAVEKVGFPDPLPVLHERKVVSMINDIGHSGKWN